MRVLVLGAGGPAGVNTCRALAGHEVVALDEDPNHLIWCAPHAEETHAAEITVDVINELDCDVVIPQPDRLTLWLADHREGVNAATFLPDRRTIALCQDKFEAGLCWRRAGLRTDRVKLVDSPAGLTHAQDELGFPMWLRARHGAGAKAAAKVNWYMESWCWFEFWRFRNQDIEFVAEGVLPGRDLAWSSIWYQGDLVCSFTRERLEYIYPGLTPEGLTGTPVRARIVHDDAVNLIGPEAVYAVDEKPHGIYSVDLREDSDGVPRPTEINAGRGFTTFGIWAVQDDGNLYEVIVAAAMGEDPELRVMHDILPEGLELVRHIDCGSFIYHPVHAA